MPEMRFKVRWPDQSESLCYSPSRVIKNFFETGQSCTVDDFVDRSRQALEIAGERVRQKYGYACSSAMDQLAQIEAKTEVFKDTQDARVTVIEFIE